MISKLIRSLENGEKPKLSKCEQMWDYLYCDDAARALYMLAQKGVAGKTYVVASGESKALKEYVEKVKDCINPDAQIGYGEFAVKNPLELRADISALTADTGFVPEIDFDEGIRRTVEWYRNTENNAE
jgi:nucleoside-diphosphate-sugar epimerase